MGQQGTRSTAVAIGRLCPLHVAAADLGVPARRYAVAVSGAGSAGGGSRRRLVPAAGHLQRLRHHDQGRRLKLSAALLIFTAMNAAAAPRALTVCADPNNMPFSNRRQQGFENKIMDLIAKDLGARITYVWWAQRRGYVRSTLNEAKCDIWPGVAMGAGMVASTQPYYRSTYVFVTRADGALDKLTLDDPRLKTAAIGVQLIGNDSMNTPPAHAIANRGIIDNVRGFMLYGDYERPNPPSAIIEAVENKAIDVALAWGPLAGYFAQKSR